MSKLFKKLTVLTLALMIGFALTACGPGEEPLECDTGYQDVDGECELIVVEDTTAPVISGTTEIAFTIGDDTPDYEFGITATDAVDGDVSSSISLDFSSVDLMTEGSYTITVTATDAAGNVATETFSVVVSPIVYTPEELIAMDMEGISFDEVGDKLFLPSFGPNGTIMYWESSDQLIITNRGFIIPPSVGDDPTTVTLTLDALNGGVRVTETFDILVDPWGEVSVTSKIAVPFIGTSEEYVVEDKTDIEIFYVDNGTVPYIDIETFMTMVDGAVDSGELIYTVVGNDVLEVSYDYEYEEVDGTIMSGTDTAVIDFTENTISIAALNFFSGYRMPIESSGEYNDGLLYVDVEYFDPEPVVIDLGNYNFDIIIYDDEGELEYLMPFAITNLLFLSDIYYNAYFNGEEIYGVDTYDMYGALEDPVFIDMRESYLNSQDMEDDLQWATYHFLALTFDYFYGLKENRGVDTYYNLLSVNAEMLVTGTDADLYNYLADFIYGMDDLHSWHTLNGYYLDNPGFPGTSISDLGPNSTAFYEASWAIDDLVVAKYGSLAARPFFEFLDDNKTCVIHFDDFDLETLDAFLNVMDNQLFPETENVVVDLSMNGGGISTVAFRLLGYMTDEEFIDSSKNPYDQEAYILTLDTEYAKYDYNWYIISSPASFSAANSTIAMAVNNDIAIVMGQKSGGGASSISALVTPDGSVLFYSSNDVGCIAVGNDIDGYEFISIEDGVAPDYFMTDVTSDAQILNIIAQTQE